MITSQIINDLFKVKESFELPNAIMTTIFDKSKIDEVLEFLCQKIDNYDEDMFINYFQEEHGSRNKLKQDFTPQSISKLIRDLVNKIDIKPSFIADICSGTGCLSIPLTQKYKNAYFHFEEVSNRTIPFLLLNLMLRNVQGEVIEIDITTNEEKNIYRLEKGEKFSRIYQGDKKEVLYDLIVSNPPFSVKWNMNKEDERLLDFDAPPKQRADYLFLLHALNKLKENSHMFFVYPHGVLFRGNAEEKIRTKLVEKGLLSGVIGLPVKMFLHTSIPTCILHIHKKDNKNIMFVNAEKQYTSVGKENIFTKEQREHIALNYHAWRDEEKFSRYVKFEGLQENHFNLNIPRYVDTLEDKEPIDVKATAKEIMELDLKAKETGIELYKMFLQLERTDGKEDTEFQELVNSWGKIYGIY